MLYDFGGWEIKRLWSENESYVLCLVRYGGYRVMKWAH